MNPALPLLTLVLLAGAAPLSFNSSQDPTPKPVASIGDFAWMAGHWRGEGLGGVCEEIWSQPLAGTMMGSFRLVKDGKVVFYELMVLGSDDQGMALKVKHFSDAFVAWETKEKSVRFPLESVTGRAARFGGLTMERNDDAMVVRVKIGSKDGATRWEPFQFKRQRLD